MFTRIERCVYPALAALALWAVLLVAPSDVAWAQGGDGSAEAAGASAQGESTRVVVEPGDSLWSISEKQLGSGAPPQRVLRRVERTYALNRDHIGADPNAIFAGQVLRVPQAAEPRSDLRFETAASREIAPPPPTTGGAKKAPSVGSEKGFEARSELVRLPDVGPVSSGRAPAARPSSLEEPPGASAGTFPIGPVGALSEAVTAAQAAIERFAGAPDAGRRLLGAALVVVSLGVGVAALSVGAVRATRPARERRRRYEEWWRAQEAFRSGASVPAVPTQTFESAVAQEEGAQEEGARSRAQGTLPATPSRHPRRRRRKHGASPAGIPKRKGVSWHEVPIRAQNGGKQMEDAGHTTAPHEPDPPDPWRIDEPLTDLLRRMPLQPGASAREVLYELRPHVEEAMRTGSLVERRRRLSSSERRQADALGMLLVSIEHTLDGER